MLNLSRYSNKLSSTSRNIPISEIDAFAQKPNLPRHISVLESPTHSRKVCQSLFHTVRQCPLKQQHKSAEAINLAVNILRYQLQDSVSQSQHLNNLRSNLQHRLEVAQAEKNERLITMLRSELKQLEASI